MNVRRRSWPVSWTAENGTRYKDGAECAGQAERVLKFCKRADFEALQGTPDAFKIDGTNFDHIISVVGDVSAES